MTPYADLPPCEGCGACCRGWPIEVLSTDLVPLRLTRSSPTLGTVMGEDEQRHPPSRNRSCTDRPVLPQREGNRGHGLCRLLGGRDSACRKTSHRGRACDAGPRCVRVGGGTVEADGAFAMNTHSKNRMKGTHALRKRCPVCRKVRRFYEPPGDQGGDRPSRAGWRVIDGRWTCKTCVPAQGSRSTTAL